MIAKIIARITDSILNKLQFNLSYSPLAVIPNTHAAPTLREIFDGYLWVPKHKTNIRKRWLKKYGNNNWTTGIKMIQPKRNIVCCPECGNFHELFTICRACFKKVQEESKKIISSIQESWGRTTPIDKEVQIVYQGEKVPEANHKRIVEMDRPRPLWFAPNLGQKSARIPREISSTPIEPPNLEIRLKDNKWNE